MSLMRQRCGPLPTGQGKDEVDRQSNLTYPANQIPASKKGVGGTA